MPLRPLTVADQPFLWEALYHAVYVPPYKEAPSPSIVYEPYLSCYAENWMQRAGDLGVGYEVDGKLVGAAWLRCWTEDVRGHGFVDEDIPELAIALLPDFRGQGIGTQLLRELLGRAKEQYASISLSVSTGNPARRLYEREGFVEVNRPDDDSITMVLCLNL